MLNQSFDNSENCRVVIHFLRLKKLLLKFFQKGLGNDRLKQSCVTKKGIKFSDFPDWPTFNYYKFMKISDTGRLGLGQLDSQRFC